MSTQTRTLIPATDTKIHAPGYDLHKGERSAAVHCALELIKQDSGSTLILKLRALDEMANLIQSAFKKEENE